MKTLMDSECDCASGAAENVLASYCGLCHGRAAQTPILPFIGDFAQLVAAGLVVPLSSDASRVVSVMRDCSMPPPASGVPCATDADINTVAQYIDNPRFWPGVTPPASVDAGVETPLSDAGADGG